MKYAIYQRGTVGLYAVEYADTKDAIRHFPYIKEESLPVIINRAGGYTSFIEEIEKKNGFLRIIEIDDNEEPLTREEMYPKNSSLFEFGWISPEGDSFATPHEGHYRSAEALCKEFGYKGYNSERILEEKGWVKVTGSWRGGNLEKAVYVEDCFITKKQADKLFDLGLYDVGFVPGYIRRSEGSW